MQTKLSEAIACTLSKAQWYGLLVIVVASGNGLRWIGMRQHKV